METGEYTPGSLRTVRFSLPMRDGNNPESHYVEWVDCFSLPMRDGNDHTPRTSQGGWCVLAYL